jgi:ketosteroid isomerase-like protein
MTDLTMEARLRAIEDQLAIYQLVSAYGYGIDGRNKDILGAIYAEDGVYAVGDTGRFEGREMIQDISDMQAHIDLVNDGCAHISTVPHVVVEGDLAVATCHTMVVSHDRVGFGVWRLSASRLQFARNSGGGWEIKHRQNYLLDGKPEGPKLLARAMQGPSAN